MSMWLVWLWFVCADEDVAFGDCAPDLVVLGVEALVPGEDAVWLDGDCAGCVGGSGEC